MLGYTSARNLYGTLTDNASSTNLTNGDVFINLGIREMLGSADWPFLEKTATAVTVASQQSYELPVDCDKLFSVTITVGSYLYRPKELTSWNDRDLVNSPTGVTSDVASYYFKNGNNIEFWPIPSSAGNTITYNYKRDVRDLSIADYATGTITTATNGSASIVGSGTTWTAGMVGMYLNITASSAASKGDGLWYKITAVGSTTTLTLEKVYGGVSIAAGSAAYTISDLMAIPEKYQNAPVYYAASIYWEKQNEPSRADRFRAMFDRLVEQMHKDEGKKTDSYVVDDGAMRMIINPNLDQTVTGS